MHRLPLIRHVRYFWLKWQVIRHYEMWAGLGYHDRNMGRDMAVLERVWHGEA